MNPKLDFFFEKDSQWKQEFQILRTMVLSCGLEETLKWGQPCYVFQKSNIVVIHGFKEYCALLFFKGVLLKDPHKILTQQTENVQSTRQIRFTGKKEIVKLEKALKACIYEAIEVEKAGLKVPMKKTSDFKMPDEFKTALQKNNKLKKAFEALTPGRQRAYLLHFSQAKQAATRVARIEKYTPAILSGKGLND